MALTEDRKTIVEILLFVSKLLDRLVKTIPASERRSFEEAWREVELQLRGAMSQIEDVKSEDSALWSTLRERGLTGVQLRLKQERLNKARNQAEKNGIWRRVLKLINSFLGSLSSVPGIDAVKEFKEMIEDTQDD